MDIETRRSVCEADFTSANRSFLIFQGRGVFKYLRFPLVILAANGVLMSFVTWMDGSFSSRGDDFFGYGSDLGTYALSLSFLLALYALFNVFRKLSSMLNGLPLLSDTSSADAGSSRFSNEISEAVAFIGLRSPKARKLHTFALAAMFVVVCFFISLVFISPGRPGWSTRPFEYPVSFIFMCILAAFYWIFFFGNALWYLLAISLTVFPMLYKLGKRRAFVVVPIAPDREGGLSKVGEVALALTYLVAAGMPQLITWVLFMGIDAQFIAGGSTYILLLVATFFGPLISVHGIMKRAREEEMERLARLFGAEYKDLKTVAASSSCGPGESQSPGVQNTLSNLNNLDALYRRAEAMPVWPFNLSTLVKFLAVIVLPIGASLLTDVIKAVFEAVGLM